VKRRADISWRHRRDATCLRSGFVDEIGRRYSVLRQHRAELCGSMIKHAPWREASFGNAWAHWRGTLLLGPRCRAPWFKLVARRWTWTRVEAKRADARTPVPRAARGTGKAARRFLRMAGFCRDVGIALAALFLLAASESWAQTPGMTGWNPYKNNQAIWDRMDRCRQQAQKQFPDYTPESNAKRDRATQLCLASQNLPPVRPLGPLPPQTENSGSSGR
jgi:hypothetical protein